MDPVKAEDLTPAKGTRLVVFARDQPQYIPLPVRIFPTGEVYSEWQLTDEEVEKLLVTKKIRLWQWSFNRPLQPARLEVV